jgi:CDGSH-type Zn-finger protein
VAALNEAIVAQKGPVRVELRAGRRYAWCACRRSAKQPYCDGSHAPTGLVPLVFKAERDGAAYLCACKTSQGRPYCDGSHNQL